MERVVIIGPETWAIDGDRLLRWVTLTPQIKEIAWETKDHGLLHRLLDRIEKRGGVAK